MLFMPAKQQTQHTQHTQLACMAAVSSTVKDFRFPKR